MRMGVVFRYRPYLGNLSMSTLARHRRLLVLGTGISSWLSAKALCVERTSLLVAELARDKEVTALQNTQARSNRYRIKVLDLERFDFFSFMFNPALEQISIFRL
jgi:hypothetical protein